MEYSDEVHGVAIQTLGLIKEGYKFGVAFSIAFRKSNINPDMYLAARIGVKGFFRLWRQQKYPPQKPQVLPPSVVQQQLATYPD